MTNIYQTRQNRVSKFQQSIDFTKRDIPENLYHKCPSCGFLTHVSDLINNQMVCSECNYHVPLTARQRIEMLVDSESFVSFPMTVKTANPLSFPKYEEKIEALQERTALLEAVVSGTAQIDGRSCVLAVMDNAFLMGSMGSVVGELITQAIEYATAHRLPVVIFSTSGGARMQEGIFSLMQMAKTSAAVARHQASGLLYISVLTNPTTGGVSASFAMLGDIIISEPGALICFAGPRVIKDTIKQELPDGFQTAEFLQEHGFLDLVVQRRELRHILSELLRFHDLGGEKDGK